MKMTRRQLMGASTAIGLTSALMQFRPTPASAGEATLGANRTATDSPSRPDLIAEASAFSSNFKSRTIASVPLAISLTSSSPVWAGSMVRMTYDSRIFSASERAVVTLLGSTALSAVSVVARSEVLRELSFALPYGLSADPSIVALPLGTPALYPNDFIDNVTPVSLTVTDPTGVQIYSESWPVKTDKAVDLPWGIELSGAWDSFTVHNRQISKNYRWPFLVNCASVGPGEIPPGSRIDVSLDPHLVKSASIVGVEIDGVSAGAATFTGGLSRRRDELILSINLGGALRAGSLLSVQLTVTPAGGRRQVTAVKNATAKFVAPSADAVLNQRATGKATLSDSTNSGSALTPDSTVDIG